MTSDVVNVLIVDDRASELFVLQSLLEDMGLNLVTASSGEEALRRLLEQDFAERGDFFPVVVNRLWTEFFLSFTLGI